VDDYTYVSTHRFDLTNRFDTVVRSTLSTRRIFDVGDSKSVQIIAETANTLAMYSPQPSFQTLYIREEDSRKADGLQAADIAAGIARTVIDTQGLRGLANRFPKVRVKRRRPAADSPVSVVGMRTEYDVYHDESKVAGYWHGILFVPRSSRSYLLDLLEEIRKNTARNDPISLKRLHNASGPFYRCVHCWVQIGVGAMLQRFKGRHYPLPTGHAGRSSEFTSLSNIIGARFILFRMVDGLEALTFCFDNASRVERTFSMALKGGLTLFSKTEELCVRSLHFDGHRHYGRRLDLNRILRKMAPEGFQIPHDITLDDASSDHREKDCQSYDDCQLLQLADVLVSGFRTVLGESTQEEHSLACRPLAELAEKWSRGRTGFSNSRWHLGFCISEASIEDGRWEFRPITKTSLFKQPQLF
jgi:hypothetical protein